MLENNEGAIKNGQSRETDNGTEDEGKQSKNTTQYELDTTLRKQTQLISIRNESFYKQLQEKTNLISCIE